MEREYEIKGLVSIVEVFSHEIGMEFGIKKCGMINMNREEEEGYKYLAILEYDRIKEELKDKFRNEYFRRSKLILKSKLNERKDNGTEHLRSLHFEVWCWNTSVNKNELQEMDRKT